MASIKKKGQMVSIIKKLEWQEWHLYHDNKVSKVISPWVSFHVLLVALLCRFHYLISSLGLERIGPLLCPPNTGRQQLCFSQGNQESLRKVRCLSSSARVSQTVEGSIMEERGDTGAWGGNSVWQPLLWPHATMNSRAEEAAAESHSFQAWLSVVSCFAEWPLLSGDDSWHLESVAVFWTGKWKTAQPRQCKTG